MESAYEFCPRCDANLTLQKGYSNELPFWNCRGCGEMLINPLVDADDDVAWICDGCGTMLNIQEGFVSDCGEWKCTECGVVNKIDASELYLSEDEYQASLQDPYKGLADEEVLELSLYEDIETLCGRADILLVRNQEDSRLYVKKFLKEYDISVYRFLRDNPVEHMPRLMEIYEGSNNLVIIEEYIEGRMLSEILDDGALQQDKAIAIAICICRTLIKLHGGKKPIIHRDIKPSNVMVNTAGEVYLLDVNVAKWYKPEEVEDTRLYGTLYYAAPEQFGYGFLASSEKSDVYAVGILLNVMMTGKMPKEMRATGTIWNIIERCINLDPQQRYTTEELMTALEELQDRT